MRVGLAMLVIAYGLSQFYRAFLAVLSPDLAADLGATPEDLAFASGIWFVIFAAMQIPVGSALDRIGPRRTAAYLLGICGTAGAGLFALATTPWHVTLGMALIGVGCSPVLMASYYIFARVYSPAVFATLAGVTIGLGSLGNIAGSAPLAWAASLWGWRETVAGIGVLTLVVALGILLTVRDPEPASRGQQGSVLDILRIRALWPIFAMMVVSYAPAAALRGLWVGPYLRDVFGVEAVVIGQVTLIMGIAMVLGNFAYAPLDRMLGTRKWTIFWGNVPVLAGLVLLALYPASGLWTAAALLAVIGFAGASFPVVVAHGRALVPAHLTGRGVTLLNLFGIGGAGVLQFATGPAWRMADRQMESAGGPYAALFAGIAVLVALGLLAYLRSADRTD